MIFKPGDLVECTMTADMQNTHRETDIKKAKILGVNQFMGCSAAYMHTDEAYTVLSVTKTGGVRLRGFAATVSAKWLRTSDKPQYR